jgi:hypothetical protein
MTQAAGTPSRSSASSDGSRAFGLGSRRAVVIFACSAALLVVVVLAVVLSGGGGASAVTHEHGGTAIGTPHASTAKYGGLPAWLPKSKTPVGQVLHASHAHPALSIQGEAISVDLGGAQVLATAAGPSVPEEGKTPVPETSPCTFVVTFAHVHGVIPLSAASFAFIDEQGHVRHPHVTAMDGGAPPSQVAPGQTVSLTVKDVLPTGDGALMWAPGGGHPIASWDFDVEID